MTNKDSNLLSPPKSVIGRCQLLEPSWRLLRGAGAVVDWEQLVTSFRAAILFGRLSSHCSHLSLGNLFLLYLLKVPIWNGLKIKLKGKK